MGLGGFLSVVPRRAEHSESLSCLPGHGFQKFNHRVPMLEVNAGPTAKPLIMAYNLQEISCLSTYFPVAQKENMP